MEKTPLDKAIEMIENRKKPHEETLIFVKTINEFF